MKKELVSIIMPCFNSREYIRHSIESVINQSYGNWELIICDDGSSDSSIDLINSYTFKYQNIILIKNKYKKGAAGARNSCLDEARGRYIAFLDSDDYWSSSKLEKQINFMKDNKYALVFSYVNIIQEDGSYLYSLKAPKKVGSCLMTIGNFIPCCSAIYDSSRIQKVYQPDIKKRNDYALWLEILNKKEINFAYCYPEILATYRYNSYGLASNKIDNIKYYYLCRIKYAKSNHLKAIIELTLYIFFTLIKKKFVKLHNYIFS